MVHITTWRCRGPGITHGGDPIAVDVLMSTRHLFEQISVRSEADEVRVTPRPETTDIVVLIPGNPGVVGFYKGFVTAMTAASPTTAVLVVGFAGHSVHGELNNGRTFDLQEQIEIVARFIKTLLTALGPRVAAGHAADGAGGAAAVEAACAGVAPLRVHVAGHSIGGYVAVHMLARFQHLHTGFLLAPTLCHMRQSPNGRVNKWVLACTPLTWLLTLVVPVVAAVAPESVRRVILSVAQPGLDGDSSRLVSSMARRSLMRNVFVMARSEFLQVAGIDGALLRSVQHRCVAYFVQNDGWVPPRDVDLFRKTAPDAYTILEPRSEVPHAWCLKHNAEVVAGAFLPFLRAMGTSGQQASGIAADL